MKKYLVLSVIVLFVFSGTLGFAKDYKDAEPVLKEMLLSLEKFVGGLEKAETSPAIAAALTEYTKAMNGFAPRLKKIMKKYPELGDEKTHPETLKPITLKMEEITKKLFKVFGKITANVSDPEVKAALDEMNKASAKMHGDENEEGKEK